MFHFHKSVWLMNNMKLLHRDSIWKKSFVQPGDLLHNTETISDSSPLQYRWHSEWQVAEGGVITSTPWWNPPSPLISII